MVLLETHGFATMACASGAALLADEMRREMGCLIIDQHMTEMEGLDVIAALRREAICVPGVIATLEKPLAVARLVELARAGLEEPR